MTPTLAQAAADYLREGHHLLALRGKRPHPKYHAEWSWDNSFHGYPDGHEQDIALIFDADPTVTGIAILIPPHMLVADIDTEEAAAYFAARADLPKTTSARTPNGLHVWFLAPGIERNIWLGGRTLLFKGFGGYVVAPPSAHFTDDTLTEQDGTYEWLNRFGYEFLPDGIAAAIQASEAIHDAEPVNTREDSRYTVVDLSDGKIVLYMDWRMDGLCRAIIDAPDGNQNNMIAWAAMTARDEGVPFEVAMPRLLAAAIEGHHPRERARDTIRGAYKRRRG